MEFIFPDGDGISQDDWSEDTLIYYVPRNDWGLAIGMKVVCDFSLPKFIPMQRGVRHVEFR